jgi:hypothetical protein
MMAILNRIDKLEKITEFDYLHQKLALKELKSMLILINQDQKKHKIKDKNNLTLSGDYDEQIQKLNEWQEKTGDIKSHKNWRQARSLEIKKAIHSHHPLNIQDILTIITGSKANSDKMVSELELHYLENYIKLLLPNSDRFKTQGIRNGICLNIIMYQWYELGFIETLVREWLSKKAACIPVCKF